MTTREKLEALFEKVRAMPPRQQELVADALADLTEEPYQLDDELELLLPELESARRGEFCTQDEVDAVLRTPWSSTSLEARRAPLREA